MAGRSDMVRYDELRRVLRLALDLRDLPPGSSAQRSLALSGLASLVGAQVALWLEIDDVTSGRGLVRDPLEYGWPNESERRHFRAYIEDAQLRSLDPSIPRVARLLRPPLSTFTRDQLVGDRDWYRSEHVQEFRRAARVDSFIYASHVGAGDRGRTISLHRAWGERPFTDHERHLVEVFHVECAFLYEPPSPVPTSVLRDLPPRLRDTLRGLARGLSEKQIAAELRISPHTLHEYVKALHRRFEVQSRAELLARAISPAAWGRTDPEEM